jgi:dUTP pyrophosphatase
MTEEKLCVKLLDENAKIPIRGSDDSAGYDLFSSEDIVIKPSTMEIVHTKISISLPKGTYGRIAPRSGFTFKNHADIGAGVIDRDYRGEINIIIFNHDKEKEIDIKKGDRIAQLIIEKILTPEIDIVEEFLKTNRGENGFGSTGV